MSERKNNRFAEILRQERKNRKMTLEQMATFLGTTKQVLSRYERGERNPKLITAAVFAQKLGIPIDAFENDIDRSNVKQHTAQLSEEDQKIAELLLLIKKHERAIEILETIPESKMNEAVRFLRYLSMQEDNE